MSQLGNDLHNPDVERKNIIGIKVRVVVEIQGTKDNTATGAILIESKEHGWAAHFINFSPYIFDGLEDGKLYEVTGSIVKNRMDYGAFWIYANEIKEVEQGGGINSVRSRSLHDTP